jgi:AcrR family transcriptional regulator
VVKVGERRRTTMPLADRRRRLVEASLRVMKRDGVNAATTRAITAEAGMPHGAFHYCFTTKQELYREVFAADIDAAFHAATAALTTGDHVEESLRGALSAYWKQTTADRNAQIVLTELSVMALRDPQLEGLRRWQVNAYHVRLAEALDQLAASTCRTWTLSSDLLSWIVLSCLTGITDSWLADSEGSRAEEQLDALADQITRYAVPNGTSPG